MVQTFGERQSRFALGGPSKKASGPTAPMSYISFMKAEDGRFLKSQAAWITGSPKGGTGLGLLIRHEKVR